MRFGISAVFECQSDVWTNYKDSVSYHFVDVFDVYLEGTITINRMLYGSTADLSGD